MNDNCECGIIIILKYNNVYIDYFKNYILYENEDENLLLVGKVKEIKKNVVDERGIIN